MKKSTLLRMLSAIDGDPEVCALNEAYWEVHPICGLISLGPVTSYSIYRWPIGTDIKDVESDDVVGLTLGFNVVEYA